VLFFRCMAALFNPIHRRREGIKWGLVSYTVVMFSLVTVSIGMSLNIQSISFIDNREFPGFDGVPISGPYGYQWLIGPKAISVVPAVAFPLTNWMADGLLLHRCYVIYSKKLWVIAFPFLMYLGSVAMGSVSLYKWAQPIDTAWSHIDVFTPCLSIMILLNIILTLMIVIRIVLHTRNNRGALGAPGGIGKLYKAVITMLIESCAFYAVSSLFVATQLAIPTAWAFSPALIETQVRTPP